MLPKHSVRESVLEELAEVLIRSAGYKQAAVIRDYAFADYLGAEEVVRSVDLAAFSEVPPSYRSACVAVARVPADRVTDAILKDLKALGAPRVVTLGPRRAAVWTLTAAHEPEKIDDRPVEQLPRVIRTAATDWSPAAMSRLSGLTPPGSYQLDFADLGLIPMIERQVNEKLDRLIREVLAGSLERAPSLSKNRRRYRHLIRVVFQLLAAKVLADREHPSVGQPLEEPREALKAAQHHYGLSVEAVLPAGSIPEVVCQWAWERIRRGFHFQNLSVDSLAFVYENSLVSTEVRRSLGIHGTPRAIAELVVGLLPLEDLPDEREVILEPCSGFAPFLLAAMRRLRSQDLRGLDPRDRHTHLVRRLRGVELDPFAVEVGRLCLTLADYPNADGWELFQDDVFAPGVLEHHAPRVGAILANPPFEAFKQGEKQQYHPIRTEKPAELLRRSLEVCSPDLLGFVVPRMLVDSERSGYQELRNCLWHSFREIDVLDLPDNLFGYSDAESALLIARERKRGSMTALRTARLSSAEAGEALHGRWRPVWRATSVPVGEDQSSSLRVVELADFWSHLAHLRKLGHVAKIHRGIEYVRHLGEIPGGYTSETPQPGYEGGVYSAQNLRPYSVTRTTYLNTKRSELRVGKTHAWTMPKVIVNAARRRRGRWALTAAPDFEGLWCYQRLFGIWPEADDEWPIALLAAVLNGPVANAFAAERSGKRDIQRTTLAAIPLPRSSLLDIPRILDLVQHAMERPALDTILRIDAEVLRGYDLPPRLERQLLRLFDNEDRPGVTEFRSYYPPGFDSALPLYRVLVDLRERHRANHLLRTVPIFHEPALTEMFAQLGAGFDR